MKDVSSRARSSSGLRGDGYVEIPEGIKAGENVVISANFLIDAESNLKAALTAFTAEPPDRGEEAMIARLIRWSASNLVLILIAMVLATGAGLYAVSKVPLDAIPDLSDTQVIIYTEYTGPGAAGGRGPGHLSAVDRDAVGAALEGGARLLVLRRLLRLRHLRGRHRHLLGALARAGISAALPRATCRAV